MSKTKLQFPYTLRSAIFQYGDNIDKCKQRIIHRYNWEKHVFLMFMPTYIWKRFNLYEVVMYVISNENILMMMHIFHRWHGKIHIDHLKYVFIGFLKFPLICMHSKIWNHELYHKTICYITISRNIIIRYYI